MQFKFAVMSLVLSLAISGCQNTQNNSKIIAGAFNASTNIQKKFIERHAPEVATNAPSLMFFTEDIFALYKKMQANHVQVGELIQLTDKYVFNFADLDGNYFAVTGEIAE